MEENLGRISNASMVHGANPRLGSVFGISDFPYKTDNIKLMISSFSKNANLIYADSKNCISCLKYQLRKEKCHDSAMVVQKGAVCIYDDMIRFCFSSLADNIVNNQNSIKP